ncbi:hypothetical protein LZ31DRAFT_558337 [Colletotrichum somersetense]|nr:hypothetical protein LZ31DRAFT_558337 [Colletotrichum somersetense]
MSPSGPETHSPPASAVSLQSTKSSSQLSQSQTTQYGSPKSHQKVQWPKLKKVVRKTTLEANKDPLPWMSKPLRRVQREKDMSLQVQKQKSSDVESWRSQLRKTQALDEDAPRERHGGDENYGDRKRADTCLTCRHETPSPSSSLANAVEHTPVVATKASEMAGDAVKQGQNEQSYSLKQKRLEEIRISSSSRSTSRTLQMTKVESNFVAHVSQTSEAINSRSESVPAEGTRVDSAEQSSVEPARSRTSDVEVFSPTPIMPPNHTCSWKERYLNLTAEVRQLKAEIVSQEQHKAPGRVDIEADDSQSNNDLGVEGLTIVMHLKGKDDLIINTNLTQASSDV